MTKYFFAISRIRNLVGLHGILSLINADGWNVAVDLRNLQDLATAKTIELKYVKGERGTIVQCGMPLVWFPDPSSGGEREGSGELPAACTDPWHFNLRSLALRT